MTPNVSGMSRNGAKTATSFKVIGKSQRRPGSALRDFVQQKS